MGWSGIRWQSCSDVFVLMKLCTSFREKSESPASDSGLGSAERKDEEECDNEDEDEWVEKVAKRDAETVFVGPVPEIKAQATVTKKE